MKKHFVVSVTALLMVCGFCCGAVEGTVNASMLNARVFPELKSPSAVKLPRGKKIEIFKRHGMWLEIAAPDITPVYTSAAYLNGNVAIRDVNLRIRPHGKAAVIGRIRKGTQLKAVSEPDRFGWVQVAPLADMRLYVMRDYVIFEAAKVPVAQKTAAPAPVPAPEKKVAPAPEKKAAPAPEKVTAPEKKAAPAFDLLPQRKRELINIGTDITRNTRFEKTGRLVAVLKPNGDCTTYALVGVEDGRSMGFDFAEAPIDLKKFVEKKIEVKGYAYKVSGWKNPVVCATEVKAIGE